MLVQSGYGDTLRGIRGWHGAGWVGFGVAALSVLGGVYVRGDRFSLFKILTGKLLVFTHLFLGLLAG